MKYFKVTNKFWISRFLIFDQIESFSFQWLRRVFQQLISHRKGLVLAVNSLAQDHGYPPKSGSFGYLLKGNFGGLGESVDDSLATKRPFFRQLNEEIWKGYNL